MAPVPLPGAEHMTSETAGCEAGAIRSPRLAFEHHHGRVAAESILDRAQPSDPERAVAVAYPAVGGRSSAEQVPPDRGAVAVAGRTAGRAGTSVRGPRHRVAVRIRENRRAVNLSTSALRLTVNTDDEVTAEECDRMLGYLREELLLLDVMSVDRPSRSAFPFRAKGGMAQNTGMLLVSGVFSATTVQAVASVVSAWLQRASARSVEIEHEGSRSKTTITGASKGEIEVLVAQWNQSREPAARTGRDSADAP
jgi:hypothetical protein